MSANGVERYLNELPNYLAPLNIRFTHTEAVRVQNCELKIFDRSDVAYITDRNPDCRRARIQPDLVRDHHD